MELTLILGPMKSGKSFELINNFAPLRYTKVPFGLYQSARHVREESIRSRNGVDMQAKIIHHLSDILLDKVSVVGIDEIHMFLPAEAAVIGELIRRGTKVFVSGLDTDYRGKLFDMIARLFELGPKEVKYKRAACEFCQKFNATYTQVFKDGAAITSGMPPVIPDDGTFTYQPVCRDCFVSDSPFHAETGGRVASGSAVNP